MLELKGKIIIGEENHAVEIRSDIIALKFDDQLFVRQDKIQDEAGGGQIISGSKKIVKKKNTFVSQDAWTEKEDRILIKNYLTKPVKELKELLPCRSKSAIYSRAINLKIKKQSCYCGAWSEEENELLRKYFPNIPTKEIVEKNLIPGRTKVAISRQAFLLGLKKHKKQKPELKKSSEIIEEKPSKPEKSNITIVGIDDADWSFEEEEFLRDNFFTLGLETIVRDNLLDGKTENQIRAKAKQMGLILVER